MKNKNYLRFVTTIALLTAVILAGGCTTTKTGSTQKANRAEWQWVPSVWVEGSFGVQTSRCSYDDASVGYFCPPGTF